MANLDSLNEDRVEKALIYLSQTDTEHARLSAEEKRLDELLKSVKAKEFLQATGSNDVRSAAAYDSQSYKEAVNEYAEAYRKWKEMTNRRQFETLVIDIWRSLEASRRRSQI